MHAKCITNVRMIDHLNIRGLLLLTLQRKDLRRRVLLVAPLDLLSLDRFGALSLPSSATYCLHVRLASTHAKPPL
jgi:hypothetical protein